MNTNVSNCISNMEQEEEKIAVVRSELQEETGTPFVEWIRPLVKVFGLLSTLAWGVAALSPDTFRIPVLHQGWVFTIAIMWFFLYCAGLFNL